MLNFMTTFATTPVAAWGWTIISHPSLTTGLEDYYEFTDLTDSHWSNNLTNSWTTLDSNWFIWDCRDYDGVNDFLSGSTNSFWNSYTVSCWVNVDVLTDTTFIFTWQWGASTRSDGALNYFNGKLFFATENANSSVVTTTTMTVWQWHHIVCVGDGTSAKIYQDWVLEWSITTAVNAMWHTSRYLGQRWDGFNWDGRIDEVWYWSKALTDGGISIWQSATWEIWDLYNSGAGLPYS